MIDICRCCTTICPYCYRDEQSLASKGVAITKVFIVSGHDGFAGLVSVAGRATISRIFIGKRHVGGYDDLLTPVFSGEQDPLLDVA